jgi:DNA (cytosine-5)-methyltransferase 1
MRYFSTFTGIGGFEIGIHNAFRATFGGSEADTSRDDEAGQGLVAAPGQNTGTQDRRSSASVADIADEGPLCVGYSEIDRYATTVFEKHFGGIKNYGDITKINAEELPDFDCLVGGFPCQAFSIAGKRGGFDDTRGTLFFDLARILRAKQPRLFVFENVKGLLSHDGGRTFATIIATIDELGYDAQWQVVNSKDFGVPQNRERIIIVGHLRGTTRPQVFPIVGNNAQDIVQINQPIHSNDRIYGADGVSPTLNTMQGGRRQPFVRVPEATKKGYAEATVGQSINLAVPNSKTRRGWVSDVAQTLDTGMQQHTLTEEAEIRRLTPVECERLQGFPDNWTANGITVDADGTRHISLISDTQRYKMAGNAVTTNVIQAVFERIFQSVYLT